MYKIIVLAVLAFASADAFWSACTDQPNALAPTRVESASCSGSLCTVIRGEPLIADVFATYTTVHNRLDVRVTAFVLGVPINLPQEPPYDDACNFMYRGGVLVGCPTVPGQEHVWRINLLISENYPPFQNSRVRCKFIILFLYLKVFNTSPVYLNLISPRSTP